MIFSTLPIDATAPSTRWVICFSISVGAAPGWVTVTLTIGKLMSGWLLIAIRLKLTMPRKLSTRNSTIGKVGFLIAQLEMLRIAQALFAATTGLIRSPGWRNAPALSTTCSVPVRPLAMLKPPALTAPTLTGRRTTLPPGPTTKT